VIPGNAKVLKLWYVSQIVTDAIHVNYPMHVLALIRIIRSRRMRWAGHVARMGEKRTEHRLSVGRPDGKRPLGRSRRRWVDNIKMDLVVRMGWVGLDWPGSV
jgi:hypothetical protein